MKKINTLNEDFQSDNGDFDNESYFWTDDNAYPFVYFLLEDKLIFGSKGTNHLNIYCNKINGCDTSVLNQNQFGLFFDMVLRQRKRNFEGRVWNLKNRNDLFYDLVISFWDGGTHTEISKEICKRFNVEETKCVIVDKDSNGYLLSGGKPFRKTDRVLQEIVRKEILNLLYEDDSKMNKTSVPDAVYYKGEYYPFDDSNSRPFTIMYGGDIIIGKRGENHESAEIASYWRRNKFSEPPRYENDGKLDFSHPLLNKMFWGEHIGYNNFRKQLSIRGRIFHFVDMDIVSIYDRKLNDNHNNYITENEIFKIIKILIAENYIDRFKDIAYKNANKVWYFIDTKKSLSNDDKYNSQYLNVQYFKTRETVTNEKLPLKILEGNLKKHYFNHSHWMMTNILEIMTKYNNDFISKYEIESYLDDLIKKAINLCVVLDEEYQLSDFYLYKSITLNFLKQYNKD